MTPAQEQAASAARKAAIAYIRMRRAELNTREPNEAMLNSWRQWSQDLPYAHEIKNAYRAAWRTTLETA